MLYTERAHFYHRMSIRGVRSVLVYSLPEHPHFYAEVAGLLGGGAEGHGTVSVMFTKWEALQLRRIVGTQRAAKMLKAEPKTWMFC